METKVSLLSDRDFTVLLSGSSISALGDQFTMVALPWLVLKLTSSPTALGLVLAAIALPRAIFMLIGGAIVDRVSPRDVLLVARSVNAASIAMLAGIVLSDHAHMQWIYVIATCIGSATAFAYPAASSLLPQILAKHQLPAANALMMSARQLCTLIGPVVAGLLINKDIHGLGFAFAIDAISFLFSLTSLALVRVRSDLQDRLNRNNVVDDIANGMRLTWKDTSLRSFMLYGGAVTLLIGGPVQVGLPLLASTRLSLGATSLGILIAASGIGTLIGSAFSGRLIRYLQGRLGLAVLLTDSLVGLALAGLALVHTTLLGALLLALIGALEGIVRISFISWIQQRVPQAFMGRVMSLVTFIFMGVGPLSAAIAGGLLQLVSLPAMFLGVGSLLVGIALSSLTRPELRAIASPTMTAIE